ncbi:hypothetical protein SLE2022_024790 [Rubroshorea leprosula]
MLNKNFELDKRGDMFVTVVNAIVVKLVWGKDMMHVWQLKTRRPLVREWLAVYNAHGVESLQYLCQACQSAKISSLNPSSKMNFSIGIHPIFLN